MKRTLLLFFSLLLVVSLRAQIIPSSTLDTSAPLIDQSSVVVNTSTTIRYVRFIPTVSGVYNIATVSVVDTYLQLIDGISLDMIDENDDANGAGGSSNVLDSYISNSLEADKVYYLGVYNYDVSNADITINITGGGLKSLGIKWTGATNVDWNTASNWDLYRVPLATDNVTISGVSSNPFIGVTSQAECNDLTVDGGASLTIGSDNSGTGSLIVNGTASGTVNAQRYMSGDTWHLISGAAHGTDVAVFLNENLNIATSSGKKGMADYNTLNNAWNPFQTSGSGIIDIGKGYEMRITGDGTVTFSGALATGDQSVSVSDAGEGWNCIGNPYTSAIGVKSTATSATKFLTENSTNLDPSYLCAYLWDPASSTYKIIGDLPTGIAIDRGLAQDYIQSGQGFFVKVKSGISTVQFKSAMQAHQPTTALKSADASWPYFTLNAATGQTNASTIIAFNKNMTKGLDPSFDAGLLRGSNGLNLYSRLVDDNGVDFAIQCLPESYSNMVIPVGIDAKVGGEIIFSAKSVGMPSGSAVILEDKTTGALTSLAEGATYKATVAANSKGTGRFFIHTSSLTTGVGVIPDSKIGLKSYKVNDQIVIDGEVTNMAKAYIYTVNGALLGQYQLQSGNYNTIPATGLVIGVYLLKVTDGNGQFNSKIIIQ